MFVYLPSYSVLLTDWSKSSGGLWTGGGTHAYIVAQVAVSKMRHAFCSHIYFEVLILVYIGNLGVLFVTFK